MARQLQRLTAQAVKRLKQPGLYNDGGGLCLRIKPTGGKFWAFRYMLNGTAREMGLGAEHTIPLAEAREKATGYRKLLDAGVDPINTRKSEKSKKLTEEARALTFKQCAEVYVEAHKESWRNAKHAQQWENTLKTYAYPIIGDVLVRDIDDVFVTKVLEQKNKAFKDGKTLWQARTETASRLRGRIEKILDWATVKKYRQGENPARWQGHLKITMGAGSKAQGIKHQPALPYAQIGDFMVSLKEQDGIAPLSLMFTIMTAARTSETIGATWDEIDLKKKVWTVPASRIKGGREHRVPLSKAVLGILEPLKKLHDKLDKDERSNWVFPSNRRRRPLSNMAMLALLKRMERKDITVHGMRSSFRDWAAEQTNFPREIAEAALAHISGDKTEASYLRTDHFEKRRLLLDAWARYCETPSASKGKVVKGNFGKTV